MREDEILRACKCKCLKCSKSLVDYNFSTDTRTIKSGDIYLPLKGENFDGENFIQDALNKGAVGYFTTKNLDLENAKAIFQVENTLTAYLELAEFYRDKINPKVVMITGSSGKTTTKEMVYSVVKEKFKTTKTLSNHNNEIGFCQTVFSVTPETEVLIVEAGMRGFGEIELVSRYAKPDIAVITNCGSAHVGRLGSLENIAKAKCEIAEHLNQNGTFIALNQNRIKNTVKFDSEKIFVSIDDVEILEKRASYSKFRYKNETFELNIEGDYNIENSLFAIEVGLKLGMNFDEIRRGLVSYKPIEKRWEIENINGFKIINDSYNANPESMTASVKTFVELYQNPVVILGNMGELGENEVEYHRQVGEFLVKLGVQNIKNIKFLLVGSLAKEIGKVLEKHGIQANYFQNVEDVSRYILDNLDVGNTIFLKASRSMKFEKIIEELKRISL